MKTLYASIAVAGLIGTTAAQGGEAPAEAPSFQSAAKDLHAELAESMAELDDLRDQIAQEKIPKSRELNELEGQLTEVRSELQSVTRTLDNRNLDVGNLQTEIESRKSEVDYLSDLFTQYIRSFDSGLHVTEYQRYEAALETAQLATEQADLGELEVFERQMGLIDVSLDRLFDALGGTRFEGTAVDETRLVKDGTFVLIGPAALFATADGMHVGTAEQRLGSVEPAVIAFAGEEDKAAAAEIVGSGSGRFPLDPTLGNAHKIQATEQETLLQEIEKGGPVMKPILGMAAIALLVALFKWLGMAFVRRPSRKKVGALLDAVGTGDEGLAREKAAALRGPVGKMLTVGVDHMNEPRELIEESMYETVLTTRLRLQRFLPFIAICAASAPLLGLLGTVTGIINTFKMITIFGSGDVKSLSGGISEALITTKFGLIVAIPSLLLHAFLSRKARGIVDQMETAGVAFTNQVASSTLVPQAGPGAAPVQASATDGQFAPPEADLVRQHVNQILGDLLQPLADEHSGGPVRTSQPTVTQ